MAAMGAPPANRDIEAARRYHQATKHSVERLRRNPRQLDWANQPRPFKVYRGLERVALIADPEVLGAMALPALEAIAAPRGAAARPSGTARMPDLPTLSRVLHLSAGITKLRRVPGGEMGFRAYSNTGALYHLDLYLIAADLPGLPAGVYHFGVHDFALHRLRSGDFRGVLVDACGSHPAIADAPAMLVCASTYWRNAWKYAERAYRHCFWDGGTLHANLLAVGAADGLSPQVVMGFADARVEALLALDAAREGALTVVPLGHGCPPATASPPLDALAPEIEPVSRAEVDYALIREMHAASSLPDGAAATQWRAARAQRPATAARGPLQRLAPAESPSRAALAEVIRRRGSTRVFDPRRPITRESLASVLERSTAGVPADFLDAGDTLIELYLIANNVQGLPAGTYRYSRGDRTLELLTPGDFRERAAELALGQVLAGHAAVNIYALCRLDAVLETFGNRGYRAAQLEGGITAGWMYLAAYAQGFGATGLTFFDDDVIRLFSPHDAGHEVMFLTALGYPDRIALRSRRIG
jgi:SagB-type dehydrogenase family enzyme